MGFELTEEQNILVDTIFRFARERVAPGSRERDISGAWDDVLWKEMGEIGLLGLTIPPIWGGTGASALTTTLALEAFGYGSMDTGLTASLAVHTILCALPVSRFGTEEQKNNYLPLLARGTQTGAFALTEPNAGSDTASLQTTARRVDGGYILNGSKIFITNAPIADLMIVMATTDHERKAKGITAFIVEKSDNGFKVARELDKMGNRSSPTGEVVFEECFIPEGRLLGAEGGGFAMVDDILVWERAVFVAGILGIFRAVVDESVKYARQRAQFGRTIIEFEMIKEMLANMRTSYEAARLMIYNAACLKDQGKKARMEASMAKMFLSEALLKAVNDAVQIHGGYGYIKEFPIERLYRDARLYTIGGGTTQIQQLIISHMLKDLS